MSTNRITGINQARYNITALQLVLKQMDPASGVAIAFRRGIARDNDTVENDLESRPWTTVEVSNLDLARTAIEVAIEASQESLNLRLRWAREEQKELAEFLAGFDAQKAQLDAVLHTNKETRK